MVPQAPNRSLSAKRESLARIHGRYQRAGRLHKQRILDEFCATCGYHRKSALRLLHRPLASAATRARPGPKLIYDPAVLLPVLKIIWLSSDQLCSKLLKAALPEWLEHYERAQAPLADAVKEKLLAISPAQLDRLLRPVRVSQLRKGLRTTRPGTLLRHQVPTRGGPADTSQPGAVAVDTVAHCDDTTAGDYVHSLTFTELFSGWTENRAVWNKSSHGIVRQVKQLAAAVPFQMRSFHSDNGCEFFNWPLPEYRTGRRLQVPWTRSRAYRKNDNAHCEQKNWTHVRPPLRACRRVLAFRLRIGLAVGVKPEFDEASILAIERPDKALWTYYLISCLIVLPLFPIVVLPMWFRYHTMRYRFTEEGISMKWGILFRREIILNYARIQDLHLRSGIIERWLGLARILVQTATGSASAEMTIEGLKQFEAVRDFVYSKMRGVKDPAHRSAPAAAALTEPTSSLDAATASELTATLREVSRELRAVRESLEATRRAPIEGSRDV